MPGTLDVYLHRDLTGHLVEDAGARMHFLYARSWLDDPRARPLSQSLPLREEAFSREECRGFFGGILPEQLNRDIIARNLHISAANDFAMLEKIGGECAGAVTFVPGGSPLPEPQDEAVELDPAQLAEKLRSLPRRPLLAGESGVRLSLAGAQNKIAVHIQDGRVTIPLGGAPTTHILKPSIVDYPGSVPNEALCLQLAHAIGLPAAKATMESANGVAYLQVERYDRIVRPGAGAGIRPGTERLHQEDFCQALGISSDNKYEQGGGPGLKASFALVRRVSTRPVVDLQRLLDAVILNFLIGNNDAHGKNFSLLYGRGATSQSVQLAPVYDILCTAHYPELSTEMAMAIGGEFVSDRVQPVHFERMADEVGLSKSLMRQRVPALAKTLLAHLPALVPGESPGPAIAAYMGERCKNKLRLFESA